MKKPLDEKYFTAEELAEIKALEGSPEVRAGERAKRAKYSQGLSEEAKARKKARERLYRLRHMYKVGKAQMEGSSNVLQH